DRVPAFGDLHDQLILRLWSRPFFAVDEHVGVGGLNANGERAVARRISRPRRPWRLWRRWGQTAARCAGRRRTLWRRFSRIRLNAGLRRRIRRLRPRLLLLARAEPFHCVFQLERISRTGHHLLADRSIAIEIQLDLVLTRRDRQPLEHAVDRKSVV